MPDAYVIDAVHIPQGIGTVGKGVLRTFPARGEDFPRPEITSEAPAIMSNASEARPRGTVVIARDDIPGEAIALACRAARIRELLTLPRAVALGAILCEDTERSD